MKGSDLFTKALLNENVKHIFGLPGEENIDLLDSISKTDIDFIVTRHEQGAAFMADAYARVRKTPGVCLSTLGPGATIFLPVLQMLILTRCLLCGHHGPGIKRQTP
jgi:acetolactate synthase-1/2/3 large subunit